MFPGIVNGVFTRGDIPLAPWSDNFQLGIEGHVGQLEPDLVVTLAGTPVSDGIGPELLGHLHLLLGNQGPGHAGAEQILALIDGPRPQGRKNKVHEERFPQVFHYGVGSTRVQGLALDRRKVLLLAKVSRIGDNLTAVVFFKPGNNNRGVQPT
ncbi:hypothetical protein ES703_43818 [subsurface metagenome]